MIAACFDFGEKFLSSSNWGYTASTPMLSALLRDVKKTKRSSMIAGITEGLFLFSLFHDILSGNAAKGNDVSNSVST